MAAPSSTGPAPPSAKLFTEPQLLRNNLREYGWSPVQVEISRLCKLLQEERIEHSCCDCGPQVLLQQHRNWEALHEHMFVQNILNSKFVTYRRAESGAPGSVVEPKQSLELKRSAASRTTTNTNNNDPVYVQMTSWITILHAVALTVAKTLEWPEETLIGKASVGTSVSSNRNATEDDDDSPMDLLRAFLYDAVPKTHSDISLGSSPHTDWGSLTVVWQDRCGGLETFCRRSNCWVPVLPPLCTNDDDNFVPLIIHIGDVTSLAIGDDCRWPSPLHRVVSPSTGRRRSLVYFCYPTQKAGSLQNLQRRLNSVDLNKEKKCLERYSLLQNQLQGNQMYDAREVYERILQKPLAEVFMEKWSQVQR